MDIAAMSVVMNQGKVRNQAAISVMKMTMDVAGEQINSLGTMIVGLSDVSELSIHPHLGGNLDVKA